MTATNEVVVLLSAIAEQMGLQVTPLPDASPVVETAANGAKFVRLANGQTRFVSGPTKAAPAKKAAKKAAPKTTKATKTVALGFRHGGRLMRSAAYVLAEITGLAQRDLALIGRDQAIALAKKAGYTVEVLTAAEYQARQ